MNSSTPPPIPPIKKNSFAKTCATISLIAGLLAIPAIPIFGVVCVISAEQYQTGEGSLVLPVLGGMGGIAVHAIAALGGVIALTNRGPIGIAWAGTILNSIAALIAIIILFMTAI